MTGKKTWWILGCIFALALGIRTLYLYQAAPSPFSRVLIIDALDEDEWARQIADGDWLGEKKGVFYRDPLYAYALGLMYVIFGRDLALIRAVQAVLDALLCVLLFFIGRAAFNDRVGLVTAALAALYGPFVFHQGLIMKTSPTLFLLALFLLFLMRAGSGRSAGSWYLTGLFLGLAVTTRSNSLVFVPLVLAAAFLPERTLTVHKGAFPATALFLAGLATTLLPLAVRNKTYGGSFTFTVPSAGLNFYHGNSAGASGVHSRIQGVRTIPGHEWEDSRRIASLESGRELTPSEVSSFWMNKGLEHLRADPASGLALLGRKALLFWNRYEVPDVYNYDYFRKTTPSLSLLLTFGIIAPLGITGILLALLEKRKESYLLAGFVLLYMLSVVAFYVTSRYRLPVVLFLLPFCAFAICMVPVYVRSGKVKMLTVFLAALSLAAIAVNMSLLDSGKFLSQSHSLLGNIHYSEKELDRAAEEYRRALAIDRYNHEAANNLAFTYLEKGVKLNEALKWSTWSVSLYSGSPDSLDTLSQIYRRLGMIEEARKALAQALSLDPENEDLRNRMRELTTAR